MAENPYSQINSSLENAIQLRNQKKQLIMEQMKMAYEQATKERDGIAQRLNDKTVQTSPELFGTLYNRWVALENKLSGGATKLPAVDKVMPEDMEYMKRVSAIAFAKATGKATAEETNAALKQWSTEVMSARISDRGEMQKNFDNMLSNIGVTGSTATFQQGNKDVFAQVNKFGEAKPIASAPNMEQFNAETGRMNAETSRMQAENESARAGAKSSSETVSTARALIDALNSYDKGKKTDIYNKLNNVADWAVPDFLTDPNQLDNQKIRAKVVDLLSQKLGTEGAENSTMTDPLDEQATKLLKAAGKAVTPETLKIVKQRLQQTKQKPKGINPNTGSVRG